MQPYLLTDAKLATFADHSPYGLIPDGAIAIADGKILWAGQTAACPEAFKQYTTRSLSGQLVTPALIDCHTHLVHGGNRAIEFEQRLNGVSYSEIARAGGGIMSTVNATRQASDALLLDKALKIVDAMIAEGVGTLEIKSGYGLDTVTEMRMLRIARSVASQRRISVRTSFLGAHALPPEFKEHPDYYIDSVCIPALEQAHAEGLVDAVDGFCENIAFNTAQIERVFERAVSLGLPVKLHAEQLSDMGGAVLAAKYKALSADHLEHLDDAGIEAMAEAGTIAVLLPGAFYALSETLVPPVEALRNAGVPIAIATDYNPGSSPLTSLLLASNMACTLFKINPEEALRGISYYAASALGYSDRGKISAGLRADLAVWDVEHPAELVYRIGFNPLTERIYEGAS